jgi:hypothetical protein
MTSIVAETRICYGLNTHVEIYRYTDRKTFYWTDFYALRSRNSPGFACPLTWSFFLIEPDVNLGRKLAIVPHKNCNFLPCER